MSTMENDLWLEEAQENFEEAVTEGNWELALAIVQDVRSVGFGPQADVLAKELVEKQNEAKEI